MCGDLEHNRTLLLCVDGDVGACYPGVGAKMSESHIGVSEEGEGSQYIYTTYLKFFVDFNYFGRSIIFNFELFLLFPLMA